MKIFWRMVGGGARYAVGQYVPRSAHDELPEPVNAEHFRAVQKRLRESWRGVVTLAPGTIHVWNSGFAGVLRSLRRARLTSSSGSASALQNAWRFSRICGENGSIEMAGVTKDFEELLACFQRHGVKALVVGAHALAIHAKPRYTKDLDVFVEPTA